VNPNTHKPAIILGPKQTLIVPVDASAVVGLFVGVAAKHARAKLNDLIVKELAGTPSAPA